MPKTPWNSIAVGAWIVALAFGICSSVWPEYIKPHPYCVLTFLAVGIILFVYPFVHRLFIPPDRKKPTKLKITTLEIAQPIFSIGQPVVVTVYIENLSNRLIRIRNAAYVQTLPLPLNLNDERETEDELWAIMERGLKDHGRDAEIPMFGDGKSNQILESNPLLEEEHASLMRGTHAVFFTSIMQDRDTKEHLIELCFFVSKKGIIQYCSRHNHP